jgi:hypothetical protein
VVDKEVQEEANDGPTTANDFHYKHSSTDVLVATVLQQDKCDSSGMQAIPNGSSCIA